MIRIAAALIDDDSGRLLLVRKAGTRWFMQAGGKIEDGESPWLALKRELSEEIGFSLPDEEGRYLGCFCASAANEPDHIVEAEVFHVRARQAPKIRSEIEEAVGVSPAEALALPLAPLTRNCILPLTTALERPFRRAAGPPHCRHDFRRLRHVMTKGKVPLSGLPRGFGNDSVQPVPRATRFPVVLRQAVG